MIRVTTVMVCSGDIRGPRVHALISEIEDHVGISGRENGNNFQMGSKLDISPSHFSHYFDSNSPKILAPIPSY